MESSVYVTQHLKKNQGSVSYRKKVTLYFEQILVEKCCRLESFGADNRLSLLRQTLPQACEREANWLSAFLKTLFGF